MTIAYNLLMTVRSIFLLCHDNNKWRDCASLFPLIVMRGREAALDWCFLRGKVVFYYYKRFYPSSLYPALSFYGPHASLFPTLLSPDPCTNQSPSPLYPLLTPFKFQCPLSLCTSSWLPARYIYRLVTEVIRYPHTSHTSNFSFLPEQGKTFNAPQYIKKLPR